MGLDMYLRRQKHIGKAKIKIQIIKNEYEWYKNDGKEYIIENADYISEEVGYWRKANQIHNWFVDNVQDGTDDCKEYWVSYEQLKKLLGICKEIKEKCKLVDGEIKNGYTIKDGKEIPNIEKGKVMTNTEIAEELLPTKSGFFFGSTDYDEYYMQDIEYTIEIIEKVLKEAEEGELDTDIYYSSSW